MPETANKYCVWTETIDGAWKTECGDVFELVDGSPHDNHYHWCPACGGSIKEVFWPDEEPDAS